MAVSVIIKDFQSVEDARFTIDGLTILRGASNQGKSGCLRALYAATHNRFRANQVRWGTEEAVVKLRLSGDNRILTVRRRDTGSPRISLGDPKNPESVKRWHKLNRDLPLEVQEWLNLGYINVSNSEKYDLNFYMQFQPPLLADFSQKKIMDVLSASTAVNDLNLVRKELEIRRVKNQGAFENVSALVDSTKARLAVLDLREKELQRLDKISPYVDKYEANKQRVQSLMELKFYLKLKNQLVQSLNNYQTLIEFVSVRGKVLDKLSKLIELRRLLLRSVYLSKTLEKESELLIQLLKMLKLGERHSTFVELKSLIDKKKLLSNKSNLLNKYQDLAGLRNSKDSLSEKEGKLKHLLWCLRIKSRFNEKLEFLESLQKKFDSLRKYQDKKKSYQMRILSYEKLVDLFKQRNQLAKEYQDLKYSTENNICPYCGQPMH